MHSDADGILDDAVFVASSCTAVSLLLSEVASSNAGLDRSGKHKCKAQFIFHAGELDKRRDDGGRLRGLGIDRHQSLRLCQAAAWHTLSLLVIEAWPRE